MTQQAALYAQNLALTEEINAKRNARNTSVKSLADVRKLVMLLPVYLLCLFVCRIDHPSAQHKTICVVV